VDKYIYQGNGYFVGLPARDLDADEWKQFPKELTKAALKAGLYKLEKQKEEVKDAYCT
jgi:hypothetical protein